MARLVIKPSVDAVGECTSSGAVYFLWGLPSATVRPLIRPERFSDTRVIDLSASCRSCGFSDS
eukprot:scaffold17793_cov69-Cylindrotheca_fusiformis.AAC.1